MWKAIKWTFFGIVATFFGLAWLGSQIDPVAVQDVKRAEAAPVAKPAVAQARECPDTSQAVLRLDHYVESVLRMQGLTFERPSIWLQSGARGASLTNREPCEYRAWTFVDVRNGFGGFTRSTIKATVRNDGDWRVANLEIQ